MQIWKVLLTVLPCIQAGVIPENIYKYSVDRDELIQKEKQYANKISLNEDEHIVDTYLSHLKAEEFGRTRMSVPTSRPIQEELTNIRESLLYKALRMMPKGGNMHTHEYYLVSRKTLLDIVFNSTDFPYLYVMDQNSSTSPWKLDFFANPPENQPWINVKNSSFYTKEIILAKQTLMSLLTEESKKYPSDALMRWAIVNKLWNRGSVQLINNKAIKENYIRAMLESALDEGVQYIETRKIPGQMYEISTDPQYRATNGKKYLGDDDGEFELKYGIDVINGFIETNPDFIGVKYILSLIKKYSKETLQDNINKIIRLREKYPKYVIGCDISAEENAGKSNLYFIDNFLSLYDAENKTNMLNLYLHVSETNFPDDQRWSSDPMDPTSALENTYEVVTLRASRVGHGLGYIKHPYLMNILKERDVAIEVCPVSNHILGFVPDFRNHPAQSYYRHGVPIVLGSDDAGISGHNDFTIDWYIVYFGWGFDLADLKHLGNNAINYSGMNQEEKEIALKRLSKEWENYILHMKSEACLKKFNTSAIFAKLLPTEGALSDSTNVTIFGSHFEPGICKPVKCKFGDIVVDANMVSVHLIRCKSPPRDGATNVKMVSVSVSLDGEHFINTKYNFTYKYINKHTAANHGY